MDINEPSGQNTIEMANDRKVNAKSRKICKKKDCIVEKLHSIINKCKNFFNRSTFIKIKTIFKWLFFTKGEYYKYKDPDHFLKWGNTYRIIITIIILTLITYHFKEIKNYPYSLKDSLLIIPLYFIFRVYYDWMKNVWNFLKKDSIVKYIFLVIIPIAIYCVGFYLWFEEFPNFKKIVNLFKNGNKSNISQSNEASIISQITAFYSTLITALAVVAGIAGLVSWKAFSEWREKINKISIIEKDLEKLLKKKELADWVKDQFQGDKSSDGKQEMILDYSGPEKANKIGEIKNFLDDDGISEMWIKLYYLQFYLQKNKGSLIAEGFGIIEKNYKSITVPYPEKHKELIGRLYHQQGLLYWNWFTKVRSDYFEDIEKKKDATPETIGEFFSLIHETEYTPLDLLNLSFHYYEKAYVTFNSEYQDASSQVKENIIIPLIEKLKYFPYFKSHDYQIDLGRCSKLQCLNKKNELRAESNEPEEKTELEKTIDKYLNKGDSNDLNHYWDSARYEYYSQLLKKDCGIEFTKIEELLNKAVKKSKLKSEPPKFFIERFEKEINELPYGTGFPGNQDLHKEILDLLHSQTQ